MRFLLFLPGYANQKAGEQRLFSGLLVKVDVLVFLLYTPVVIPRQWGIIIYSIVSRPVMFVYVFL